MLALEFAPPFRPSEWRLGAAGLWSINIALLWSEENSPLGHLLNSLRSVSTCAN